MHFAQVSDSVSHDFRGMAPLYRDALRNNRPDMVFEIKNGRGRLLFLIFFSKEDKHRGKIVLHLILRRTKVLLPERLVYGNHFRDGKFLVYFNRDAQEAILEELGLEGRSGDGFAWSDFFSAVDGEIPAFIPYQEHVTLLRSVKDEHKEIVAEYIDESTKIHLKGIMRLPGHKRPRDKTLRKLIFCSQGSPADVERLILRLRAVNATLVWSDKPEDEVADFVVLMDQLA